MDEDEMPGRARRKRWPRKVGIALAILFLALLVFHRPVLFAIGRAVAAHYAAKENLKIDCRLEGNIFTRLVVRNLHIVPTGRTSVESIDADFIQAEYSLITLLRHGPTEFIKNVEARTVRVVLNPRKEEVKPKIPRPDKRITLPTIFPEHLRLSDGNLVIRSAPQDFVLEHLELDLNPNKAGYLRAAKLQIPARPAWSNLSAQTSYAKKKLILQGLLLDSENQIRLLAVDASRIKSKAMELALDSSLAGGTISGSVALQQTRTSLETRARVTAEKVSLDTLRGYMGRPQKFLSGDVERLTVEWSGALDVPRSWNGTAAAQINNLKKDALSFDRCDLRVTAGNGAAVLESGEFTKGLNKIVIKGTADLPKNIRDFGRAPARFEVTGSFPDLQSLTAAFPQPLTGSASLSGLGEIKDATIRTQLTFGTGPIDFGRGNFEKLNGTLTASKRMPQTNVSKVYYADLQTEARVDIANLRSGEHFIDSAHVELKSIEERVEVKTINVVRKKNSFVAHGEYILPVNLRHGSLQPARLSISLGAENLADYWAEDSPNKVTGPLQISGEIKIQDGLADGAFTVFGSNLKVRNLEIPLLSTQVSVFRSEVYLNDLTANLNETDFVRAHGTFALQRPFKYSGRVSANIVDLARLKPLLAAMGNYNELAGALVVDWEGSGEALAFNNSGQLKLNLEKGRYAMLQSLQAKVEATYSPEGLDIPIVYIGSDRMMFQAIAQAKGETLEITKIQIDQAQAKYAAGYISFPFVWKNIGTNQPVIPSQGKVLIGFQSENLDIKKLFEDVGAAPIGSGLVNIKLDAQGTLANLGAKLEVQMRDLRWEKAPNLDPASFDLTAQIQDNQLALKGKLQQTKIQPVQIDANLPFNAAKIIEARKFDESTPITAKVQLPRSSVNFLHQFLPGIQTLDGDVVLDVDIKGTVADPIFSGTGDMTINLARFNNATLPALSGFQSRLIFNRDTLTLERFKGELAGGPFTVSGRVTFPKLTEPNLDFQVKAQAVLVARNDTLTARADADLKVIGPFAKANVTGNVAFTNSQFLKDIDLIPIGLPGRPAPQPTSYRPTLSFPEYPVRDWTFDVAIKTKDPFLIRGNLANGGAIMDLHMTGTGFRPGLQGFMRLENVEATLPFSRLEIARGFLNFDPSDSLNPKMDLQGTSLIRDYTVHVYVYGNLLSPEAVFTSEPPLPQEEIISLLATGTTRQELLGNNNVLAGRAAMLLVQQLYRKIVKKGQPTKSNSVFDRLYVDLGRVDPRTGQQTATAHFKMNEQWVLVGDLGVEGDFRGVVKYLIRFR